MREVTRSTVPRVFLFGPVRCDDVSREELITELADVDVQSRPRLIFNINAHALNLALGAPALANVFNTAYLTFCDGFGIVLLARFFRIGHVRHRMTPPDFVDEVYARLAAKGGRVFLLGDQERTVSGYAQRLEQRWPGLVAGWESGFFDFGSPKESAILGKINASGASLLLLGMGMPRQEIWATRHAAKLQCGHVLSVGALFGWGDGRRRGPRWATDRGLEWLFRLIYEPRRVWKRYLIGLPQVAWRLWRYRSGAR